jgi:hypothetical protein
MKENSAAGDPDPGDAFIRRRPCLTTGNGRRSAGK